MENLLLVLLIPFLVTGVGFVFGMWRRRRGSRRVAAEHLQSRQQIRRETRRQSRVIVNKLSGRASRSQRKAASQALTRSALRSLGHRPTSRG